MHKLLLLILLAIPACTVRVYEMPAQSGYSYQPMYRPMYRPVYQQPYVAPYRAMYGGGYQPHCQQEWHVHGGINLNPNVNRRRGW